jgi:hypothetical protein
MKLCKMDNNEWKVLSNQNTGTMFKTIEQASDYLMEKGISDKEIDLALTDIYALNHSVADFGVNGTFISSSEGV